MKETPKKLDHSFHIHLFPCIPFNFENELVNQHIMVDQVGLWEIGILVFYTTVDVEYAVGRRSEAQGVAAAHGRGGAGRE